MSFRLSSVVGLATSLLAFSCSSNSDQSAFPADAGGGTTNPPSGSGNGTGNNQGSTGGGFGSGTPVGGDSDAGAGPESDQLTITVRDFRKYDGTSATNPDFENVPKTDANGNPNDSYQGPWDDPKIVTDLLGADKKPVYAPASGGTVTTHGKAAFDQWFRDVDGMNLRVSYPIHLTSTPDGVYAFDSEKTGVPLDPKKPDQDRMFFPIDDGSPYQTKFGNEGDPHNYSFTVELHTTFVYHGGEYFDFRGDDDVFVYIDGKRVINLGGIHAAESARVEADQLGLVKGQQYPLDFFSAERHRTGSNILFTTTLALKPGDIR